MDNIRSNIYKNEAEKANVFELLLLTLGVIFAQNPNALADDATNTSPKKSWQSMISKMTQTSKSDSKEYMLAKKISVICNGAELIKDDAMSFVIEFLAHGIELVSFN